MLEPFPPWLDLFSPGLVSDCRPIRLETASDGAEGIKSPAQIFSQQHLIYGSEPTKKTSSTTAVLFFLFYFKARKGEIFNWGEAQKSRSGSKHSASDSFTFEVFISFSSLWKCLGWKKPKKKERHSQIFADDMMQQQTKNNTDSISSTRFPQDWIQQTNGITAYMHQYYFLLCAHLDSRHSVYEYFMILSISLLFLFIREYIVESRHRLFYSHANIIRYMNVCMSEYVCWLYSTWLAVFCFVGCCEPPKLFSHILYILVPDGGKFLFSTTLLCLNNWFNYWFNTGAAATGNYFDNVGQNRANLAIRNAVLQQTRGPLLLKSLVSWIFITTLLGFVSSPTISQSRGPKSFKITNSVCV